MSTAGRPRAAPRAGSRDPCDASGQPQRCCSLAQPDRGGVSGSVLEGFAGTEGLIHLLLWKPSERFTESTEEQIKCNFSRAQHPSLSPPLSLSVPLPLSLSVPLPGVTDLLSWKSIERFGKQASNFSLHPVSVVTLRGTRSMQGAGERGDRAQARDVTGRSRPNFWPQASL